MSVSPAAGARLVALAALLVTLVACGTPAAAPAPPAAFEPHPAMAIVDRVADRGAERLPDLEGLAVDVARARLATLGLRAQVVTFDTGPVSAQHPEAGAAPPSDGRVVIWTGAPPEPPPPPEPEPEPTPTDPPPGPDETDETPAPEQQEEEPDPAPEASPSSTPKPQRGSESPTPARTSPRDREPTPSGTVLEGLASWYGPGFEGRTTACGQRFDPSQRTLATRELRCGTEVRITGPGGRTVDAVVNDWGPAEWTGRRFDLSRATFEAIHPLSAGVVEVRIEILR